MTITIVPASINGNTAENSGTTAVANDGSLWVRGRKVLLTKSVQRQSSGLRHRLAEHYREAK